MLQTSLTAPNTMTSLLDSFFNDGFFVRPGRAADSDAQQWRPVVDLSQTADSYTIDVELPGFKKDQVSLSVEDHVLRISGERSFVEQEGRNFTRVERRYGSFTRTFELPKNASVADISASFEDGVLSIVVPKAPEAQARQITIG